MTGGCGVGWKSVLISAIWLPHPLVLLLFLSLCTSCLSLFWWVMESSSSLPTSYTHTHTHHSRSQSHIWHTPSSTHCLWLIRTVGVGVIETQQSSCPPHMLLAWRASDWHDLTFWQKKRRKKSQTATIMAVTDPWPRRGLTVDVLYYHGADWLKKNSL